MEQTIWESRIRKPVVSKLLSKVSIVNGSSIDIDEKMAEIIESIKNSDKLGRPIHSKMMTSDIIDKVPQMNTQNPIQNYIENPMNKKNKTQKI